MAQRKKASEIDVEKVEVADIDADLPASLQAADDAIGKGIVERGRTVEVPTGEKEMRGFDREGNALYRPVMRRYGPGQEVELPMREIRRLRELGFLTDPNRRITTLEERRARATQEGAHSYVRQ